MSIRYKYVRLLTEGYNFSNADEVMSAIKSNQIGVKIDPSFKTDQGSIPTKLAFKKFFERCNQLGIKDTTYGVQLLLSKTTRDTLGYAIVEDGIYEFLKSYKKPWVKELPEYKEFINSKYNKEVWHKLEKAIQDEQSNHGKVAKGSGQLKDVKVAYDDGTWKLLIPSSFEGEKAAAFYIRDGKETPTAWCTRCAKSYYNEYTKIAPLYIIRNMKTGKSYQMGFEDWGEEGKPAIEVAFLDQDDVKGDEITKGDLSKIPSELLKHIKIPIGSQKGKTMAEYNTAKEIDPNEGKKGYIKKGQTTFKVQEVDKKLVKAALEDVRNRFTYTYYQKLVEKLKGKKIYKAVSKNGTRDWHVRQDKLTSFANSGIKEKHEYEEKAGIKRYYLDGEENQYYQKTFQGNGQGLRDVKRVNDPLMEVFFDHLVALDEHKTPVTRYSRGYERGTSYLSREEYRREKDAKDTSKKFEEMRSQVYQQLKKDMDALNVHGFQIPEESPEQQRMKGNGYDGMTGRKVRLIIGGEVGNETEFIITNGFSRKHVQWLPNTAQEYEEERNEYSQYNKEEYKDLAWKIMSAWNRAWRQKFQSDIIQKRVNKEYTRNMYEEVDYFPY